MLTGANLDRFTDIEKQEGNLAARCVATVGIGNSLRVEYPVRREKQVGTINLLCVLSTCLTKEAFLEALSIATEARTAAVMDSGIRSIETGLPATGTGTDCIVIAAPVGSIKNEPLEYVGKHTLLGSLIGQSVFEAVRLGIEQCKQDSLNEKGVSSGKINEAQKNCFIAHHKSHY